MVTRGSSTGYAPRWMASVACSLLALGVVGGAVDGAEPSPWMLASGYPLAGVPGWIAYQAARSDGSHQVVLIHTDGSDRHIVSDAIGDQVAHPEWSPDGGRLAVLSSDEEGSRSVWVHDLASGTDTQVAPCVTPCLDRAEQGFSADGRSLVIGTVDGPVEKVLVDGAAVELPATCGLATVDIATSALTPLVTTPCGTDEPRFPAWSPDGTHIAFFRTRSHERGGPLTGADLVVMEARPGAPETVVAHLATWDDDKVDWSPDSTQLVFSQDRGLRLLDLVRDTTTELVPPSAEGAGHPRWTGDQILFSRRLDQGDVTVSASAWAVESDTGRVVEVLPEKDNELWHYAWPVLQPVP